MTYSVINTQTCELFAQNGTVALFSTFQQARVHRITLNDQTKTRHGHSGCAHGWTERSTHWQVIESVPQSSITNKSKTVDVETPFYVRRSEITTFYFFGDINPIKRAPRTNTKAARQRAAIDRAAFSRQIKNTKPLRRRKSS